MSISKHTSCQLEKSISLLANVKIQYHFFPMSKFKCTCQCQNSLQHGWISFQWHQEYSMLRSSCEFRKCEKQQTRLQSIRPSCFTTPIRSCTSRPHFEKRVCRPSKEVVTSSVFNVLLFCSNKDIFVMAVETSLKKEATYDFLALNLK